MPTCPWRVAYSTIVEPVNGSVDCMTTLKGTFSVTRLNAAVSPIVTMCRKFGKLKHQVFRIRTNVRKEKGTITVGER